MDALRIVCCYCAFIVLSLLRDDLDYRVRDLLFCFYIYVNVAQVSGVRKDDEGQIFFGAYRERGGEV